MTRPLFRAILAVMLLASAVAAVGARGIAHAASGSDVTDVKIDNFSFGPQTITIPVGTQVRWTNHDDIPHNTVSEEQLFKSNVLDTDQAFSYTFTKPGTYKYYCSIHPRMTGTVVVQ